MNFEELRNIPLFRNMTEDIFELLIPLVKEEHYPAGERIFEEGSLSDRFFIIKAGEVEIRKLTDRKDRQKLIAVLSTGEFFGEMAVFLGQPRSAGARAKTDVTFFTIGKDGFSALFSRSPEAAFKIMEFLTSVLMDRLRNTTKDLVTVDETGKLVTAAHSIQELSEHVMDGVFNAMETTEAGVLVIWNEFNSEFEVCGQRGFDHEVPAFRKDDGLVQWFMENRESFLSFNLQAEQRLTISDKSVYSGCSMVASPFFSNDSLLGFMFFLNRKMPNAFSYNHMILLSAISGYVTIALENLKHIQDEINRSRLDQARGAMPLF